MFRILLAHGSRLIRQALAVALSQEKDFDIAWELSTDDDIPGMAQLYNPDLILLDYALPDSFAVAEICRRICSTLPTGRVLVLVERRACAGLLPVLSQLAPRVGTISVADSVPRLIEGIRQVLDGKYVLDMELAVVALTARRNPLTEREKDILRSTLHGEPAKEIAERLHLSPGTVRNYLSRVLTKTGARSRIEAARRAQEAGWI